MKKKKKKKMSSAWTGPGKRAADKNPPMREFHHDRTGTLSVHFPLCRNQTMTAVWEEINASVSAEDLSVAGSAGDAPFLGIFSGSPLE